MIAVARDWLPGQAFADAGLLSGLKDAVSRWSRRWFGEGKVGVARSHVRPAGGRGTDSLSGWRDLGSGIFLREAENHPHVLACLALDVSGQPSRITAIDNVLLAGFGDRVAADLAREISAQLAGEGRPNLANPDDGPSFGQSGGIALDLEGPGGLVSSVGIVAHKLVAARKAGVRAGARSAAARVSVAEILARQGVDFRIRVGNAHVSLAELRDIAVGDVVALEAAVSDGVELLSAGNGVSIGRAHLAVPQGVDGNSLIFHGTAGR